MRGNENNKSIGFYRSRRGTFFGVLNGIANYFGFKVIWLRIATIVALFITGFVPVLFIYLMLILLMKKEPAAAFQQYYQQKKYQGSLYRSRNGLFMGLLKGIADRFDLSLFWLRFLTIIGSFFTGFVPGIIIYTITSLLISKEPVIPLNSEAEAEFYDSYAHSRQGTIHRVKRRFDRLEARIRRMESSVTDREFDWGHQLKSNH
ncbi:MAG: PspC domain-containing protein [Deltaproteobacteria bacterium]|jgi:phage shock protein C|nr:PspC domain-containing protein [Deltaproteobacteria bacterium]MBT4526654.1 PspC domain-containing protein [Deltaproteobacteria bacterium]